jgi:hypothetical protein
VPIRLLLTQPIRVTTRLNGMSIPIAVDLIVMMYPLYRRHLKACPYRSRRFRRCQCPIHVQGSLRGEKIRKALDLTSWEAASDLIAQWNGAGEIGVMRPDIP